MKKILSLITATLILCLLTGCKISCSNNYLPEYESGYFRYAVRTEKSGEKKAYLVGLTESGAEQANIIYPEELDGIPVYGIGYKRSLFVSRLVGYFGSDNLEKLFFQVAPKEDMRRAEVVNMNNTFTVYWNLNEQNNGPFEVFGSAGTIFGYEYYVEKITTKPFHFDSPDRIANVSYMYNYDNSPNKDYYWVDSYDESVITFIPPVPEREGYEFVGWYKEPECINEWDFETDITGKEIVIGYNKYDKYDGIYLYAKWISDSQNDVNDISAERVITDNLSDSRVPDGVVLNSSEDIEKLSIQYPDLGQYLSDITADNFFENSSYLLINFYHSSSERNIEFLSCFIENNTLKLVFNIESPECVDDDFIEMPFILKTDKLAQINKFEIGVNNLLLNNHKGGWNSAARDLVYF